LERAIIRGDYTDAWTHIGVVLGYAVITMAGAIILFLRQMKKQ
jgi:ABC-2 type transport system permease protein